MSIQLKRTKDVATNGVKILVYGQAGAGKTTLIASLEKPVILSAEGGLLSLSGTDIPYIEIKNMDDLNEAFVWVTDPENAKGFQTICLDSISEIAEVILNSEKARAKDPRQAYGSMADQVSGLIRAFRDIPGKDVYFTAKLDRTQDDMSRLLFQPSLPGAKAGQNLPYFFDEVLALRCEKDPNDTTKTIRWLQTTNDGIWLAKDRSGKLDPQGEFADLGAVIAKIKGEK